MRSGTGARPGVAQIFASGIHLADPARRFPTEAPALAVAQDRAWARAPDRGSAPLIEQPVLEREARGERFAEMLAHREMSGARLR